MNEGETLYLTRAAKGSLNITPNEPVFEETMQLADDLMNRYRNALRELAK